MPELPREPFALRRRTAILTALWTSALFVGVYSLTNARAASLPALDTWAWEWEQHIPLVDWMIVPYMSIDLFFVATPFICGSRREIRILGRRMALAILAAGLIFWLWPLRLALGRQEVEGFLGPAYAFLHGFDQPHNLFPSLHVTLMFIIRWTWHRKVGGRTRTLLHIWFALISLSTLLTHQHQVIDLLGGLILALLVFYAIPTGSIRVPDSDFFGGRRAGYAGLGGMLLLGGSAGAVALWQAEQYLLFWLCIWGLFAIAMLSLGYAGLGARVFRKYQGYLSLPTRALLAPVLAPLWISRRWFWRRAGQRSALVHADLRVGQLPDSGIRAELDPARWACIDLCAEHSNPMRSAFATYRSLPLLDGQVLTRVQLDRIHDEIEAQRSAGHGVYLHCALGYGRSARAAAWWLWRIGACSELHTAVEEITLAQRRADRNCGPAADSLQTGLPAA